MTPKELAEYAKVMRKHGISSLRAEGLEIKIDLNSTPGKPIPTTNSEPETQEAFTEEDVLLWSSTPV